MLSQMVAGAEHGRERGTLSEAKLNFPAFWGAVGRHSRGNTSAAGLSEHGGNLVWNCAERQISLWVEDGQSRGPSCWHSLDDRRNEPAVFVWGHPFVASNSEFGKDTTVERVCLEELPNCICHLYERHGTEAFARLEGNFTILLLDRKDRSVFLAVDRFGCDDVFICAKDDRLSFASHPSLLLDGAAQFDAVPTAFFLAQEGFVPAPFTLFDGMTTVGRGRFLQIRMAKGQMQIDSERYGRPSRSWKLSSRKEAVEELLPLIKSAVDARATSQTGILLSGGTDSALLANLLAYRTAANTVAVTGTVKGYPDGELEIAKAGELARALNIAHETVVLDPADETLPEEWALCTESWTSGTRVTLPLFNRFARRIRERLGDGYRVLSGQMADTLADNNYTLPSAGYTLRRLFYSSAFHRAIPLFRILAPTKSGRMGKSLGRLATASGGVRAGGMAESILDGLASERRFYEGRVFGYGEMPGRSKVYFPSLSDDGFHRVADWYSSQFIEPIVAQMRAETFYRDMIELSMDMAMLHLDTRLVFHVFRLGRGKAEMPFLDSRVVNFFASLPSAARAFYREPKHAIRAQFKHRKLAQGDNLRIAEQRENLSGTESFEQLLLRGSLGSYFRELLSEPTAVEHAPGLFEFVDERYFFHQIRSFIEGTAEVDYKFISRVAALESWSRMLSAQFPRCHARATA